MELKNEAILSGYSNSDLIAIQKYFEAITNRRAKIRVLICGSRSWTDKQAIMDELIKLKQHHDQIIVIEGEAPGADTLARECAEELGLTPEPYPANWKKYGRYRAGKIRNTQMLKEGKPELVIAFHDGHSTGTLNMMLQSKNAGVPVICITKEDRKCMDS